jgi:hypothetical protein
MPLSGDGRIPQAGINERKVQPRAPSCWTSPVRMLCSKRNIALQAMFTTEFGGMANRGLRLSAAPLQVLKS